MIHIAGWVRWRCAGWPFKILCTCVISVFVSVVSVCEQLSLGSVFADLWPEETSTWFCEVRREPSWGLQCPEGYFVTKGQMKAPHELSRTCFPEPHLISAHSIPHTTHKYMQSHLFRLDYNQRKTAWFEIKIHNNTITVTATIVYYQITPCNSHGHQTYKRYQDWRTPYSWTPHMGPGNYYILLVAV